MIKVYDMWKDIQGTSRDCLQQCVFCAEENIISIGYTSSKEYFVSVEKEGFSNQFGFHYVVEFVKIIPDKQLTDDILISMVNNLVLATTEIHLEGGFICQ